MRTIANSNASRARRAALIACALLLLAGPAFAHEEGHERPDQLPPVGPHGGEFALLERHFAEVVVRGNEVRIYILEPDVKHVAEDASGVTAVLEIPGQNKQSLSLEKRGEAYVAQISIPPTARRVQFRISCVLDGRRESGVVQYEPRG